MPARFLKELESSLADSRAELRRHWVAEMIEQQIALQDLMSLWHSDPTTAQRFMWFIGELCEADPERVAECMPLLFSLRDQMPFPGMDRSVAKWLWLTNIPVEMESAAIDQLYKWLCNTRTSISCKHYCAKSLFEMAKQARFPIRKLATAIRVESRHSNPAHASRNRKLLDKIERLLD